MTDNKAIEIDLEGLEEVFRICGRQTGMAALNQRIADFVKETDPRIARFMKEMEKYDKPKLQGSPVSDNNKPKEELNALNYFAPQINLQKMLQGKWFSLVCTHAEIYNEAWTDEFIVALMDSEHKDYLALKWGKKDQRLMIKGHIVGLLCKAGVIKGSNLAVARAYLGVSPNSRDKDKNREVTTFAKYMGNGCREPYADWVMDYVSK